MFHVKICGITRAEDIRCSIEAGADAIGLNFYPQGRRYVDPEAARELVRLAHDQSSGVAIIGVFVNATIEEMVSLAAQLGLDGIQLHGDESVEVLYPLRRSLQKSGQRCQLIRAVRTSNAESQLTDSARAVREAELLQEIEDWEQAGIDAVLLDAAEPGQFGGTGKAIDWQIVSAVMNRVRVPLVLAGGLTPENVSHALAASQVNAVDVASGVESAAGIKDELKVKQFVQQAMVALARRKG